MNPTQSIYSQLYSVTITKYFYMFRPFVDQHQEENMQQMCEYHLTYEYLCLLHINFFQLTAQYTVSMHLLVSAKNRGHYILYCWLRVLLLFIIQIFKFCLLNLLDPLRFISRSVQPVACWTTSNYDLIACRVRVPMHKMEHCTHLLTSSVRTFLNFSSSDQWSLYLWDNVLCSIWVNAEVSPKIRATYD